MQLKFLTEAISANWGGENGFSGDGQVRFGWKISKGNVVIVRIYLYRYLIYCRTQLCTCSSENEGEPQVNFYLDQGPDFTILGWAS